MDQTKVDKIVEVLYDDTDIDVDPDLLYEYETEMYGHVVKVKRYGSALPMWLKSRAERRMRRNK